MTMTNQYPDVASERYAAARGQALTTCPESVPDMLNAALLAERISMTFYYTGLTTPAIMGHSRMAGSSADPNAVARDGNPRNVSYLQAALDQEHKHARLLESAGARSSRQRFYFPASTFRQLGYTSHRGTFLWVLDHLETTLIGLYLATVERAEMLGRPDIALLAMRMMGVQCEHRALYRMVSGDDPANNVTIEVASFSCVGDAVTALRPYLTGQGFRAGAAVLVSVPAPAHVVRAVGRNVSR